MITRYFLNTNEDNVSSCFHGIHRHRPTEGCKGKQQPMLGDILRTALQAGSRNDCFLTLKGTAPSPVMVGASGCKCLLRYLPPQLQVPSRLEALRGLSWVLASGRNHICREKDSAPSLWRGLWVPNYYQYEALYIYIYAETTCTN